MKNSTKILIIVLAAAVVAGVGAGSFIIGRNSVSEENNNAVSTNQALTNSNSSSSSMQSNASAYLSTDSTNQSTDYIDQNASSANKSTDNINKSTNSTEQSTVSSETASVPAQKYIGQEEALSVALKDAGLSQSEVSDIDVDLEFYKGESPSYSVDFDTISTDYEYLVDAYTGKVLNKRIESNTLGQLSDNSSASQNQGSIIARDEALSIALKNAGLSKSEVYDIDVELDNDGGYSLYDVSFNTSALEYEYDIDPYTGEILFSRTEKEN